MAGTMLAVTMAVIGLLAGAFAWSLFVVYGAVSIIAWMLVVVTATSFMVAAVAWFNRKEI